MEASFMEKSSPVRHKRGCARPKLPVFSLNSDATAASATSHSTGSKEKIIHGCMPTYITNRDTYCTVMSFGLRVYDTA